VAYNPASTISTTSGLNHVAVTFYNKRAMSRLLKNTRFLSVCEPEELPLQSGKIVQ